MIEFKLKKDDECIIALSGASIKNINFISSKIMERLSLHVVRDIELTIEVDNASLDQLDSDVKENTETEMLREIDSVRDLFNYAVSSYDSNLCYLDGEIEILDSFTRTISKFNFKNLFVIKFDESFISDTRETQIFITMRERA